ncbi:hypothetical protein B7H20_27695 [Pseudomonas aeruginosa]|uniref:VOC family protein n=1 Tax=Pseudomonas psychrophila TaxID=122355 RepID=A0A8I1FXX2_9PSED|nr:MULTISPECIES: VOC family protein [Pseudomonadaceae]MBJ2260103.1 VOC family protein [Pseudomonas psychrophila]ORL55161.1 hypothetical protein B7H20_27695 [Pseudomonas aeruginosa]
MNQPAIEAPRKEQFLGMSHGTLECHDIAAARAFRTEFLGLETLRHSAVSFVTWREDRTFYLACVETGEQTGEQGLENRWELSVASDEEVVAAHQEAERQRERWDIRAITPVSVQDGFKWFAVQDADGNWWGVTSRGTDWFDKAFASAGAAQ